MNHCVLEVEVSKTPTIRYTQENKTPIAEMEVLFQGLRTDDPPGELKVVGWGNMAQELQSQVKAGQKLILEGRLRMNTVPRQDGTKEKRAELTLSRMHTLSGTAKAAPNPNEIIDSSSTTNHSEPQKENSSGSKQPESEAAVSWDSSPLVPDTDEIPF